MCTSYGNGNFGKVINCYFYYKTNVNDTKEYKISNYPSKPIINQILFEPRIKNFTRNNTSDFE